MCSNFIKVIHTHYAPEPKKGRQRVVPNNIFQIFAHGPWLFPITEANSIALRITAEIYMNSPSVEHVAVNAWRAYQQ